MSCGPLCDDQAPFPVSALRRGRCAHGRAPRAQRLCPLCGRIVPREYAEATGRAIVVAGAAQAGKSTWLAEVVRQLSTGEVAYAMPGLSMRLLGESSRALDTAEPLLISIRLPARARPIVLALYDDWPEPDLDAVAGVVLLLDPTRLPSVRQVLGLSPLPALTSAVSSSVPVAVTVSKLDLVWDMFDSGSPLRRPCLYGRGYAERDGLDVHHEVEAWLARWGGPGLTAGWPAGSRCFATAARDGAYRVVDPLLWLLTRLGAFGVARGRS